MEGAAERHHDAGSDASTRLNHGYYVWVFGERSWFADWEGASRYACRANAYCPAEFIDVQELPARRSVAW